MAPLRRAVDLARTLRGQAGLKVRQPLARLWLALPGARGCRGARRAPRPGRDEVNVKSIELIGDESELVDRRRQAAAARRSAGSSASQIPAVMAAARASDGSRSFPTARSTWAA